jgi:cytochrome c6
MFNYILFAIITTSAFSFIPNWHVIKSKLFTKIATTTIISVVTLNPFASFAADLENGEQVFAGNCAACHAGGNNIIQNEKTLRKEALELYLSGGFNIKSIIYQVTNGKNSMPAFGARLEEEEINDVASYVYDQASGNKWE